ncbi:MAG: VOC family protein [Flavobacteriia bacterium]|nr:VOC family protein [Flavobacteriia bacterium]
MIQNLAHIALIVDNYDKAIKYYTTILGFELLEDTKLSESKRWVLVKPKGSNGTSILLAQASTDEQISRIGNQTGGRVFLFLHTTDFDIYHESLMQKGVKINRQPVIESWGKVLVFEDLYGNLWDLIEKF